MRKWIISFMALCTVAYTVNADEPLIDVSLKLESLNAVENGIGYLVANQKADGSFSGHPGITAVSTIALRRYLVMTRSTDATIVTAIANARTFILSRIGEKGSVMMTDSKEDVYSTAVCLMALALVNDPRDAVVLKTLRNWLIVQQIKKAGGFAYGKSAQGAMDHAYPDLSNSQWALEAVTLTYEESERKRVMAMGRRLRIFIGTCQIVGSDSPKMDGGFLYFPVKAKAVKTDYKGTDAVWGSLTMGALKSLRFSRTDADADTVDAQIANGLKWVAANYDLSRNPGLKQGGWYYYTYMFSSAMVILKKDLITTPDGKKHSWRSELLEELMSRQKNGDHWENANSLWMEGDSNLCTAYALNAAYMALEDRKRQE